MTLAEFLKEYSLLVTTITGLITLILGYYLGKWDAERKRKWELEDRDYKRRAEIWDMKITEARQCLGSWAHVTRLLQQVVRELSEKRSLKEVDDGLEWIKDDILNLSSKLVRESSFLSIGSLHDGELTSLSKAFGITIHQPLKELILISEKILEADDEDSVDIKEFNVDGFDDALYKGEKIIEQMKAKVGLLAQKVP